MKKRLFLSIAMLTAGGGLFAAALANGGQSGAAPIRNGGEFHVALVGATGTLDPSLTDPDLTLLALLDTTCARLMAYPDKNPPQGYRLVPEVAAKIPAVSPDGRKYTFVVRRDFRFSNRARVGPSAFVWAITRTLRLHAAGAGNAELGTALVRDIVGARDVAEGRAQKVTGIAVRGNRLVIRLVKRVPSLPARMSLFCAVPPNLPVTPEGLDTFHAAGPYYVAEHVRGRRIVLKRNPFYGGSRPQHVKTFVADGQSASNADLVGRVQQGLDDWGWAPLRLLFDPALGLRSRYGLNRSQLWLRPGLNLHHYFFNSRRGLFRNNPRLRRAVNFAVDRPAVRRQQVGFDFGGTLTDQYLPPGLPGFVDRRIYPLDGPRVKTARALAGGHRRGGKLKLYTLNVPSLVAVAQVIQRNLAKIGLEVEVTTLSVDTYFGRLLNPDEPWDLAWTVWAPDHLDPFTYLNELFDAAFIGVGNLAFNERQYNRLLRRTARMRNARARYTAYGKLDALLARKAAPSVAMYYAKEPTFVSRRVDPRCIVLRPWLDLTAVCLKR